MYKNSNTQLTFRERVSDWHGSILNYDRKLEQLRDRFATYWSNVCNYLRTIAISYKNKPMLMKNLPPIPIREDSECRTPLGERQVQEKPLLQMQEVQVLAEPVPTLSPLHLEVPSVARNHSPELSPQSSTQQNSPVDNFLPDLPEDGGTPESSPTLPPVLTLPVTSSQELIDGMLNGNCIPALPEVSGIFPVQDKKEVELPHSLPTSQENPMTPENVQRNEILLQLSPPAILELPEVPAPPKIHVTKEDLCEWLVETYKISRLAAQTFVQWHTPRRACPFGDTDWDLPWDEVKVTPQQFETIREHLERAIEFVDHLDKTPQRLAMIEESVQEVLKSGFGRLSHWHTFLKAYKKEQGCWPLGAEEQMKKHIFKQIQEPLQRNRLIQICAYFPKENFEQEACGSLRMREYLKFSRDFAYRDCEQEIKDQNHTAYQSYLKSRSALLAPLHEEKGYDGQKMQEAESKGGLQIALQDSPVEKLDEAFKIFHALSSIEWQETCLSRWLSQYSAPLSKPPFSIWLSKFQKNALPQEFQAEILKKIKEFFIKNQEQVITELLFYPLKDLQTIAQKGVMPLWVEKKIQDQLYDIVHEKWLSIEQSSLKPSSIRGMRR